MNTSLSPFTRRLLAVALLIVVLALPYWLLVRPLADRFAENRAAIEEQIAVLQRFRSRAADIDALKATLGTIQDDAVAAEVYLTGNSEALVAAALQDRLKTVVAASGGRLASSQALPASEVSGFRQVTIRVRATMDIGGLSQTLSTLETDQPVLFVDNLDISARSDRARPGDSREDQELTVSFDVYGFMKGGG